MKLFLNRKTKQKTLLLTLYLLNLSVPKILSLKLVMFIVSNLLANYIIRKEETKTVSSLFLLKNLFLF